MNTSRNQAAQQSMVSFLSAILPAQGVYMALELPDPKHAHFDSIEALAAHIGSSAAEGVYHACAAFQDGRSRRVNNVRAVKAFWLDLDCGETKARNGSGYADQTSALTALDDFCAAAGLPAPMVVNSGYGLHAYWPLSSEISPECWQAVAGDLKRLTAALGLLADPSRTSDITSVLRPVGSWNRKDAQEQPVELLRDAQPLEFAQFKAAIEAASERLGVRTASARPANSQPTGDVVKLVNPSGFTIEQVEDALKKIDPDCDYREWSSIGMALADAFGEDARGLFHRWSSGALAGETKITVEKYDALAADKLFNDALERRFLDVINRATIDGIMARADPCEVVSPLRMREMMDRFRAGDFQPSPGLFADDREVGSEEAVCSTSELDRYRPDTALTEMPARTFAGPRIGKTHFFPHRALSLFTALGSMGKTSTLVSMATHVAAGKDWGKQPLSEARSLMFFVEEDQEELNRKFGAVTHDWDADDRKRAADNLRLVSLHGESHLLAVRHGQQVLATGLTTKIVGWAKDFGAELIVLDHLQGFADGDLNSSETAATLAQAANTIVAATGAAVVFAAHVNKGQINAEIIDAGFTSGSLAFENAARQVTGAIKVPKSDIDALDLDDPDNTIKLAQPKNSYGPAGEVCYLKKEYVPAFHTMRVQPLPTPQLALSSFSSATERLHKALLNDIAEHPGTTRNRLDAVSGKTGRFKASKAEVRRAVEDLIDDGVLRLRPVTKEEKEALRLPQQTREILELVD